jgi:hypothetical protein
MAGEAFHPAKSMAWSTVDVDRSLAPIEVADLLRLAALAVKAEAELFKRDPRGSGRYVGRQTARRPSRALTSGRIRHRPGPCHPRLPGRWADHLGQGSRRKQQS